MARINIEERWWTDPRRKLLIRLTKSEALADGVAVSAWRLSQSYYKTDFQIPAKVFELSEGVAELVGAELAIKNGDFYYVAGSRDAGDYLIKRSEAGHRGGVESAKSRRSKSEVTSSDSNNLTEAKRSKRKQTQPSPLISSNLNTSNEVLNTGEDRTEKIHWLGDIWNAGRGTLGEVKTTKSRLKAIEKRLKENPAQDYWMTVVAKIAKSDFCNGDNDRGWTADFDWLVGVDRKGVPNHVKVSEDRYINKSKGKVKGTGENANLYQQLEAKLE